MTIGVRRKALFQKPDWLWVRSSGFVTDIMEPNDLDCVLLFLPDRPRDRSAVKQLRGGLPFLEMKLVGQEEFDD